MILISLLFSQVHQHCRQREVTILSPTRVAVQPDALDAWWKVFQPFPETWPNFLGISSCHVLIPHHAVACIATVFAGFVNGEVKDRKLALIINHTSLEMGTRQHLLEIKTCCNHFFCWFSYCLIATFLLISPFSGCVMAGLLFLYLFFLPIWRTLQGSYKTSHFSQVSFEGGWKDRLKLVLNTLQYAWNFSDCSPSSKYLST